MRAEVVRSVPAYSPLRALNRDLGAPRHNTEAPRLPYPIIRPGFWGLELHEYVGMVQDIRLEVSRAEDPPIAFSYMLGATCASCRTVACCLSPHHGLSVHGRIGLRAHLNLKSQPLQIPMELLHRRRQRYFRHVCGWPLSTPWEKSARAIPAGTMVGWGRRRESA